MPTPPKKPGVPTWVWVVSGVVVLVILVCVGALIAIGSGAKSVAHTIKTDQQNAKSDVTIAKCTTTDSFDSTVGDAKVTITNHSSTSMTYLVTIAFDSANGDTQYDTTFVTADDLAAGQTTTLDAEGTATVAATPICKVTDVERF